MTQDDTRYRLIVDFENIVIPTSVGMIEGLGH